MPNHRKIARALLAGGVAFTSLCCLAVPVSAVMHRFHARDWSRAAYYGYPGMVDRLPAGTTILDRSHDGNMGFALAGRRLQNRVVHLVGPFTARELAQPGFEYAATSGPPTADDATLAQYGDLVFDGVPATIFPQITGVWRIYRMRRREF